MRLWRLILREIPEHLKMLAVMTVASSVSVTAVLWLVNEAAREAAQGITSSSLLARLLLSVGLFTISQHYLLVTASHDVEALLHRMRIRIFEAVRRADLVTVESIGRAALSSTLVQETQTLAQNVPMLMLGAQQVVMLVCLGLYLAWLSPIACVMAFGFAGLALALRFSRMVSLGKAMEAARGAEIAVFDGLTDLLRGFKEVRMSDPRAEGVQADLGRRSAGSREINTATKKQWGREFALLQTMFYGLIGVMVFVVPRFAPNYHQVVVEATIVTLFIIGPVGTLAYITPLLSQTEFALSNIAAMEERLGRSRGGADESAGQLSGAPVSISLDQAVFAYPGPGGFRVGPLSAEFRAGEITFITGGNGSGKSTMLRVLTGLVPAAGGRLLAGAEAVATEQMQSYRDQISAVLAENHLSRRLYGLPAVDPAQVNQLLARLEMTAKVSFRDGAFSTVDLSLGQRKRLALVVALLEQKPVIVLDEWAAGQDPYFRRVFYEEILPELKAQGKIVICVTHDDRWFGMADQVLRMSDGRFERPDRNEMSEICR